MEALLPSCLSWQGHGNFTVNHTGLMHRHLLSGKPPSMCALYYILERMTQFISLAKIQYQIWFFCHTQSLKGIWGSLYFHLSFTPFQVTDTSFLVFFQLSLITVPFPWTPFHKHMYITCGMSRKLLICPLQEASEGYAIDRFLYPQHY